MTAVRLGWRVAFDRRAKGRFTCFTVVGAVVCSCLLLVVMVPALKAKEHSRYSKAESAAMAQVARSDELGNHGVYVNLASYNGRTILLVSVPDTIGRDRLPPGLDAPPRPGEVRFSPALADRVDHDPALRTWFPYRRLPDLPPAGVGAAGEYKAYIGVSSATAPFTLGAGSAAMGLTERLGYYQWLGLLLFVAAPAVALMAMSTRFGRRRRRERLAALRLLGMPGASCRTVLGIETGLPVAVGAALPVAVAVALQPHHVVVPLVERWVFGADAQPSAGLAITVFALTSVLGFFVGASTPAQRSAVDRVGMWVAKADVTRSWTLAFYVTGLGLTVGAWLRVQSKDEWRFLGAFLVGLGLPGAVAISSGLTARLLRRANGRLIWFIAMRKVVSDPRGMSRVAGLIGVLMFVIGSSQPISQFMASPQSTWTGLAREDGRSSVLGRSESGAEGTVPLQLGDLPVGTILAAEEVQVRGSGSALVASCDDLQSLFAGDLSTCDGTVQQVEVAGLPSEERLSVPSDIVGVDGSTVATVPSPLSVLELPEQQLPAPRLVVPPEVLPPGAAPAVVAVYMRTRIDADAWTAAQGWVISRSPAFRVVNEFETRAETDSTGAWLMLGLAFSAMVATLGVSLSSFDEHRSAGEWMALRALGFGWPSLVAVRTVSAFVTAAVAVALATAPALIVTASYLRLQNEDLRSTQGFYLAALLGAAVIIAVNLVSTVLQMRRVSRHGSL